MGLLGRRARYVLSVAFAVSVVSGVLTTTEVSAAATTCKARDVTTKSPPRSNVQEVLDGAKPGDTIEIRGLCVGNLTIEKDVTLAGVPTNKYPQATLHGTGGNVGHTPVLYVGRLVAVELTVHDLTITGGGSDFGGGIFNVFGTINLTGATRVTGNRSNLGGGGGIYNADGTVNLYDSSSVSGNTGFYPGGGGISNDSLVTLNDHASVSGNTVPALQQGGGIYNDGFLIMNDSSTVSGNAAHAGGGIYVGHGTLTMNDSATVTDNNGDNGAGIYLRAFNDASGVTLNGDSAVTNNTATLRGGGIYALRRVVALNGRATVSGSTANRGGGIFLFKATTIMSNKSSVATNTAHLGGGMYVHRGEATLRNSSTITGNFADDGGGLFNEAGTVLIEDQATVTGNQVNDCVGC
jgi:predicted outer membrane repeat protein